MDNWFHIARFDVCLEGIDHHLVRRLCSRSGLRRHAISSRLDEVRGAMGARRISFGAMHP